jgi:hypothetical protein
MLMKRNPDLLATVIFIFLLIKRVVLLYLFKKSLYKIRLMINVDSKVDDKVGFLKVMINVDSKVDDKVGFQRGHNNRGSSWHSYDDLL